MRGGADPLRARAGFAEVKRGICRTTGQQVAVKIADKTHYQSGDVSLQREVTTLCRVQHPNCLQLYECYVTTKKVYMVTELVSGGQLLNCIVQGGLGERYSAHVMRQVLQGIQYLHSQGIVHRDLKLENIVLLDNSSMPCVKIVDFGLSKCTSEDGQLQTLCGSPQYLAPEMLSTQLPPAPTHLQFSLNLARGYTPAVDMWSAGVVLYTLLSGMYPFVCNNDALLFNQIQMGEYDFHLPCWDNVSAEAKSLVSRMLTLDPAGRITPEQALSDPWLMPPTHAT